MNCASFDPKIACGLPIPPVEHAISVSLPTWKDNLDYEEDKKRVVGALVRGYPRFIVHESIRKLGSICVLRFGDYRNESCLLFPTRFIAEECRLFIERRSSLTDTPVHARLAHLRILPSNYTSDDENSYIDLHIVIFPLQSFPLAKQFWQHSGLGVSTRLTALCLEMLATETTRGSSVSQPLKTLNGPKRPLSGSVVGTDGDTMKQEDGDVCVKPEGYLEVQCHHNLTIDSDAGDAAKRTLRRRIAGFLDYSSPGSLSSALGSGFSVSEDDVFLFPTGMAAVWNAHQLAMATRSRTKSICYGFLYTDTLKILQKWGPGCHHLGRGLEPDIKELQDLLDSLTSSANSDPPVPALFTEFPSNPLLQSFNLPKLRALADKYGFLLVIDDTIGTAVNVDVLPYADIIVTSLSKFFSGYADVMGGSLVLNPQGRHYQLLKSSLSASYVDTYFSPDAVCMELNSRDFEQRIRTINSNTEHICDFLRSRSLAGGAVAESTVIRDVFYPKYVTREHYEICRRPGSEGSSEEAGGFGGLFSLMFTRQSASRAFYDALSCCKGPSLGTTFTLSCPYTILAHFAELEWAAEWGVEEGLVRVSVGVEPLDTLMEWFRIALDAAETSTE